MADVKYSLDDNIKQNFLEPLHHLQTKDLKEVMVSECPSPPFNRILCVSRVRMHCYFYALLFSICSTIARNCKDGVWITIASGVDKLKVMHRSSEFMPDHMDDSFFRSFVPNFCIFDSFQFALIYYLFTFVCVFFLFRFPFRFDSIWRTCDIITTNVFLIYLLSPVSTRYDFLGFGFYT